MVDVALGHPANGALRDARAGGRLSRETLFDECLGEAVGTWIGRWVPFAWSPGPTPWLDLCARPAAPPAPESLDALAQHFPTLRTTTRKREGLFYTPAPVVAAALDRALPTAGPVRLCDPACGTGNFLIAAARRLLARDEPSAVAAAIHGVDRDPVAVAICRALLWKTLGGGRAARAIVELNIRLGDALLGPIAGAPTGLGLAWAATWPDVFAAGGFTTVVGNPPFRGGRLAELQDQRALLAERMPTAEYQLDPYLLFIDRGLRLLRPLGRVALVVPNAWLSNERTGALRRWALGENRLDAVIELPGATFAAGVEAVISVGIRGGRTPATVPVLDLEGAEVGTLLFDGSTPAAVPPVARSAADITVLEASLGWARTLGDIATVTRGVNPYHHTTHRPEQIAARVHHADHQVAEDWRPELRGRHLTGPFRHDWPGDQWIHYGPWLKEPRKPRFFEGPRLLVRKILGETLHAIFLETPFICDQSVYIARFSDGQPFSPWTVLACVNSTVMARLLRTRHQEHDRLFPQIKVGELRGMPLPPVDPAGAAAMDVARRAEACQLGDASPAALAELDRRVAGLYGV